MNGSESFKTVVIGTSLTPQSDGVVRTGAAVARACGASPWLIHAFVPPPYPSDPSVGQWIDMQSAGLHDELAEQARRTGLADLPGFRPEQLRTKIGSPARQIVELAQQEKADLIVLGAEEAGVLHRIFLGSTADGVIRKTSCPVLIVRSEQAFPPARVEIPVDLSPLSAKAYRKGLAFLGQMGVPLTGTEVLFVLNPFELGGSIHFTVDQVEHFAGEELRRFMAANSPNRLPHQARIRTGYAREEIVRLLKEKKVDLAILGTHGRTGLERLAVGSVASGVMHQAACNLLLLPPEAPMEKGLEKETADALRGQPFESTEWTWICDEEPAGAGGFHAEDHQDACLVAGAAASR